MSENERPVDEANDSYADACVRSVRHTPVLRITHEVKDEGREDRRVAASRGLVQMFGLDVRAALLVTLVDLMIFGVNILSIGAFILMGMLVAGALGFIVYRIQRHWFGDDHESSLIKALIVGLLTAIPVPLTPLMAVPCGIVGLIQMVRRPAR